MLYHDSSVKEIYSFLIKFHRELARVETGSIKTEAIQRLSDEFIDKAMDIINGETVGM